MSQSAPADLPPRSLERFRRHAQDRLLLHARGEKVGMRGSRLHDATCRVRNALTSHQASAPHPNPLPVKNGEREFARASAMPTLVASGVTRTPLPSYHATKRLSLSQPQNAPMFQRATPHLRLPPHVALSPRSSSGLSRGPNVQQLQHRQVRAAASTAGRRIRGWLDPRDKPEDDSLQMLSANLAVTRSRRAPRLYRQFWGQTHGSDPMARAHGTSGNAKRLTALSAARRNLPQPLHLLPTTSSRRRPGPTQVSAISTRPGSRSTRATRSTCATGRPALLLPTTSPRRRPGPTQVSATWPGSRSTRATRSTCATGRPALLLPTTSPRCRPGPTQVSATWPGSRSTRATRSTCATGRPALLQPQPTSPSPRSPSGLSRGPNVQQGQRSQAHAAASISARRIRGWRDPRDKPEDDSLGRFDGKQLWFSGINPRSTNDAA
jgi:hypothetical protein